MIKITIGVDGSITSKVSGVKGKSCQKVDEFLTKLGTKEKEVLTDEFYQQSENKEQENLYLRR